MKGGSNLLLSAVETADLLGIHVDTLYKSWRKWNMRGYYIGRQLRFRAREVEAFIDRSANDSTTANRYPQYGTTDLRSHSTDTGTSAGNRSNRQS